MIGARAWTTSTKHLFPSNARKLSGVYLFPKSAATPAFLFHWFLTSSLACRRLCAEGRIACFLRKLREYHVIRIAQQACEFVRRQSVPGFERDPLRARQVRRRNDVGTLPEFSKIFR